MKTSVKKTTSINWTKKYEPTNTNQVLSNNGSVKRLKAWLKEFPTNQAVVHKAIENGEKKTRSVKGTPKSCILVTGNHGTGKTMAVKLILKELKYEARPISFDGIKNSKEVKEIIKSILNSTSVVDSMNNDENKKIAIIVDELDAITSPAGKSSITSLRKENDTQWHFPIIFISSNKHSKLLSDLKKSYINVIFFPPFPSIMKNIMMSIVKAEKMKITNSKVISKIVSNSQSDVRRLIHSLQDLYELYGTSEISLEIIKKYFEFNRKKDTEHELFDVAKKLLYEDLSWNKCLDLYNTETVLVPLMILEHFPNTVFYKSSKKSMTNEKTLDILKEVCECLSSGDIVENIIYGSQNWDLKDVHCFLTCIATSYKLNKDIEVEPKKEKYDFTKDLTHTSSRNINRKNNILKANKFFPNRTIYDYIFMNKIMRHYIDNNQIAKGVKKVLKDYPHIDMEYVDAFLKIDKIKTSKHILGSKQKTEFENAISN
jgi:SpoVK/Ycf46/Vps4 family AAA+-type ATPase